MARLIRPLAAGVVGILLLCMPAFLNQSAILFTDSQSYYVGGHMVIDRAVTVIDHLLHPATGPIGAPVVHAKAVRSIYYSLLSYLLADTASLWAISVVQAALTVWVIAVTINTFQPTRRLLPILVALMLLSTLPWTVSMFMPDIFTPLTILAIACLAFAWPDLSRNMRLALLVMLSSSIVMHFTNVPIAVGLAVVAVLMWPVKRWAPAGAIAAAIAISVAALVFVSVVGFGKWTIAPQNPPFVLARSIADGPSKLYLRERCPQINLVMCHHLDGLDSSADDFIWSGVFAQASPEEQDAIRAESRPIVLHAAIEHPWLQLRASVINYLTQLGYFDLMDTRFPNWAEITPTNLTYHIDVTAFPNWLIAVSAVDYLVVALSLLALAWVWRDLPRRSKQLVILVIFGVLLNAVTGPISEPAPRYGARVMWLIPLMAFLLVPSWRSAQRNESNRRRDRLVGSLR